MRSFRSSGVDVLVCLLTDDELAELDLTDEAQCCQLSGMEFVRFPIPDRAVPADEAAFTLLVESLCEHLNAGRGVAIHCRQGIGRSALLAARVLCAMGDSPAFAFERIIAARGWPVPDTVEQREWVIRTVSRS
ncbi:MAG TPA: hypothetical protein VHB77_16060 [Planctomycetaceae bacterium]|nr:hypothetical protein [Planctomycetaceae bacterium]